MNDSLAVICGAVLSSSVLTAVITQIGTSLRERSSRRAREETDEAREISTLKEALMYVLYDRIRYLAVLYIHDGEISFEDRCMLHKMHAAYHNRLGGNGDLDPLMADVDRLPLKEA